MDIPEEADIQVSPAIQVIQVSPAIQVQVDTQV